MIDALVILSPLLVLLLFLRVGLVPYILLQTPGALIGFTLLDDASFDQSALIAAFVLLNLSFLVGYLVLPRRELPRFRRPHWIEVPEAFPVLPVVLIVGGLGTYHIFKTSALLHGASSIETDRFDFTSSGLLGIPGRMYLYGIPLVWALSTAVACKRSVSPWRFLPWQVATSIYVLTSLLSGFKSGIFAMVVVMALCAAVIYNYDRSFISAVGRRFVVVVIACVYAFAVAGLYPSYSGTGESLTGHLLDRVTTGAALPKAFVLRGTIPGIEGNSIVHDFEYFIPRYAGQMAPGSYSTERAVSAAIYGVNPASPSFTTPVTMGGFPELMLAFGLWPAMALIAALGMLCRRIETGDPTWLVGSFLRAALVFGLSQWIIRGDLAYYVLNVGFSLAVVLALVFAFAGIERVSFSSPDSAARSPRQPPGTVRQ